MLGRSLYPDERAWLISDWHLVHLLLWNGYTCIATDPLPVAYSESTWHVTNFPFKWNDTSELDEHVVESCGTTLKLLDNDELQVSDFSLQMRSHQ